MTAPLRPLREYVVQRAVLQAIARAGRVSTAAIQLECQGTDERDIALAVRHLVAEGVVERTSNMLGHVGVLHDLRLTERGRHALNGDDVVR